MKRPKSEDERVREMVAIRQKMRELGLHEDDPDVARLIAIMNDFVRGTGHTGVVPLKNFGRTAIVKLSLRDGVNSEVTLRVTAK